MGAQKDDFNLQFLAGGGEMGKLTREKNWSTTAAGAIAFWPQSLRTTLSIILHSKFPMFLYWGPELICFYNDAYIPGLLHNAKHPAILGMKAEEALTEHWPAIQPLIHQVLCYGEATWSEDQQIQIYNSNGKTEDLYWNVSYSPVNDESGKPAGVLVTCAETTLKVKTQHALEESKNKLEHAINTAEAELEKQVQQRTKELIETNRLLKEREERYHLMVEEVQDYAILYLNRDGIVENWNTGAAKIKGYTAGEIIGRSFSNFYTEEDKKINLPQNLLKKATETGRAKQEGWRVRKDGSRFWASVVITAVHNEKNEVIGFSKVTHDLTAKKNADDKLKKTALELEQKNIALEKMNKELQSFTYISSHDLQEPLRKIQTFIGSLVESEYNNLTENGKDRFKRMQNAAERMQTLIDDLLTYSRTNLAEKKFKRTDLNDIFGQVKAELREELQQKNAVLEAINLCEVNIIPFQFSQLLHNLISNALKFSKPEEPPRIIIESTVGDSADFENNNLPDNTRYCRISVSDNGIGFEQNYSEKIFGLFQRLHGRMEYRGTGIGLAIVKKIVENHNGIITATGELNKGATFNIYIPLNSETAPVM